jgi:hypothetical protein
VDAAHQKGVSRQWSCDHKLRQLKYYILNFGI